MNSALILHHYDFSSFSEKVRLVLGMKNLSWRSVEIPSTLPKPDYLPLTGGYRRAPALQIGADVFCNSVRIIAEPEKRFPEPSIYPGHDKAQRAFTSALERWTDSILIPTTVNYISALHPTAERFTPEFLVDRAAFFGKSRPGLGRGWETAAKYLAQLRPQLSCISEMLGDGRPYICGDTMSLSDCIIYHPLWILDQLACERVALIPNRIRGWMDRIATRGHGQPKPMTALEAIDVAVGAAPLPPLPSETLDGDPTPGETVSVTPLDTGRANSSVGVLVSIDATRMAILHRNDRVDEVMVHFPRFGYRVRSVSAYCETLLDALHVNACR
jgi:glutathione S-transferase